MTSAGSDLSASVDRWLEQHGDGLIALRRELHANPEISGAEYATTRTVADHLDLAGLTTHGLSVGTGLWCDLDGDGDGRRIAIRADLDALAMHDDKDVTYRSLVDGVSHACGHDVHTVTALGTALYFARHRDRCPGNLRFVFQPAEERVPGGALDVLADDALSGCDAIVGLHCEPKLDVGTVGVRRGPVSSAADMIAIDLAGPGGHTARPELTIDLIAVAARVVAELPSRVAELLGQDHEIKLVFGSLQAGDAANVIPTRATLRASVRTPSLDAWEKLPDAVERALGEVLADTGAQWELDYTHGVPPVINDHEVTEEVARAAMRRFGDDRVVTVEQSWGGDDFAWYTREIPGSYVRLGVHDPASTRRRDLHAGHFDVDERSIAVGIRLLTSFIEEHFA
ncbi:MAG: amidohydrolase [Ilumatobacteraceae bacterium]|nr:amidohydrolase [Ilumatobacteraceae bacterium]